jgi:hypothetical protein
MARRRPQTDCGRIVRLAILNGQPIGQIASLRRESIKDDRIEFPADIMTGRRPHTLPLTPGMRELLPDRVLRQCAIRSAALGVTGRCCLPYGGSCLSGQGGPARALRTGSPSSSSTLPRDCPGLPRDCHGIATGTVEDQAEPKPEDAAKDPAAVALGRRGGLKGGKARAAAMTPERRAEAAKRAAEKRWQSRGS